LPKEFQDKLAIHKDKNPNINSKTEIELRGCPSLNFLLVNSPA